MLSAVMVVSRSRVPYVTAVGAGPMHDVDLSTEALPEGLTVDDRVDGSSTSATSTVVEVEMRALSLRSSTLSPSIFCKEEQRLGQQLQRQQEENVVSIVVTLLFMALPAAVTTKEAALPSDNEKERNSV